VTDRFTGHALAWQIEHNGGWHWQVGECTTRRRAPDDQVTGGAYLALLGPTDAEHQWRLPLAPGESFTTVPVAIAVSDAGFDGAIARLTACRRASRRPHSDHQRLPVIFNDYMNTIMADPTTERLLPLISAAARAGAEYFCIDAGWYADLGEDWWGSVGAWQPSAARFPGGITEVLDHIRAEGMIPGLWLEPEVVGVHSPVATQLPPEAFFCRDGVRVIEQDRYHLDLRHPAALKHLNEVVDFLVGDLGVGYLKLDYNIDVAPGTETGAVSPGAGLLGHNRALLDWLDGVLDRHPGLTIENCGSGGMRVDYGLLSRVQLQSTSDQQDFLRYPPIAAGLAAAITPEQAAVWAYPQPAFSDDEITFTMSGALLGRVHLSGHLDQMTEAQQKLVAEAVRVYKDLRADLASAVPFWPLGLPRWNDSWLALGMRPPATPGHAEAPAHADISYLVVWHRGALDGIPTNTSTKPHADPVETTVPLQYLRGHRAIAEVLYPPQARAGVTWSSDTGQLTVALPTTPTACLIRLTPGH
jgi:alpha-galactosidase